MKNSSITFGTILLVLGCFALSPAAQAGKGGPGGGGSQGGSCLLRLFPRARARGNSRLPK